MAEALGDVQASIDRQRATWQFRVIEATRGNQTRLGTILIAVLGKAPSNPPRIGSGAEIDKDGRVFAHFQTRDGQWHLGHYICMVHELVDNMRGLADHLKLADWERNELFSELRKWINKDHRADTPEHELNLRSLH